MQILSWTWWGYSYEIYEGPWFTNSIKDGYIHYLHITTCNLLSYVNLVAIQRSLNDAIKGIDKVLIKQLLNSIKVPKNIPMSSPIV